MTDQIAFAVATADQPAARVYMPPEHPPEPPPDNPRRAPRRADRHDDRTDRLRPRPVACRRSSGATDFGLWPLTVGVATFWSMVACGWYVGSSGGHGPAGLWLGVAAGYAVFVPVLYAVAWSLDKMAGLVLRRRR